METIERMAGKDVTFELPNFEPLRLKAVDFAASQGREYGIILSSKGEVLAEKPGEAHQVNFEGYENLVKDNWILHSHPNNSSLSPQDIKLMQRFGLKGVIAVGPDGSVFGATGLKANHRNAYIEEAETMAGMLAMSLQRARFFTSDEVDIIASVWMGRALGVQGVMDYRYRLGEVGQAAWSKFEAVRGRW